MKINEVTVNEAGPQKPNPLDLQPLEGGSGMGGGYSSGSLSPARGSVSPKIGLSGTQSNVPGTLRVGTVDKPPALPTPSTSNLQTRLDKMQGQDIPAYQRAAKPEPNVVNKPSVWKDPRTGEVSANPPAAVSQAQSRANPAVNRLDPRYKPENDPANYTAGGKYIAPGSKANSTLGPSARSSELKMNSPNKTAAATAGIGTALALAGGSYLDSQHEKNKQKSQTSTTGSEVVNPPTQAPVTTQTKPVVKPTISASDVQTQGVTGSELARISGGMFMNKADRLNQDKVDSVLGPGYKAGSKEANLALLSKFKGAQSVSGLNVPSTPINAANVANKQDKTISSSEEERAKLMNLPKPVNEPTNEDGEEKWIQKAIKHPGALTKKAKAAHMSTSAFAKKHAHDKGITGKQARLAQTLAKMHETKESEIMNIKESINFKELMTNADADVQAMLIELQQDVETFKETGHSSDLLDSFLKVHLHNKKKIADEAIFDEEIGAGRGVVNPPVVNPNAPVPPARTASPGWGKDDYKPLAPDTTTNSAMGTIKGGVWQSDPKGTVVAPSGDPEGVKEAGSFIRDLASSRKKFEGKEMKDVQFESWEKELNSLLNEGITVSSSQGQQGSPDSVSVTATDNDAQSLMSVLRNAGIGGFGAEPNTPEIGYGVVQGGEEEFNGTGTEPQPSPKVVGDGDDMLSLIKKMSGISDATGDTTSSDYEDEEGEEVDEQYLSEPIVAKPSPDNTNPPSTPAPPPATPGSDGTNEDEEVDEGNKYAYNVLKAKAAGKKEADLDGDGKMDKVKEGHDHEECNECGYPMESCECDHEEQVEEGFSNDAGGDAMAETELAKLKALLSMGGDLHKMKRDQTVGNPTQVSMAESLAQWKKLSGIK